jgi:hypothetical protein
MSGAISVNRGNSYVRQLLEGLTSELRAGRTQRQAEGAAKNSDSPKDTNGHGDQAALGKQDGDANDPPKNVLRVSSADSQKISGSGKSSGASSSSAFEVSRREVNGDGAKARSRGEQQRGIEHDVPVQDPERSILSGADKLNRKVSDFYARYHMDLELIRASNLGIRVPLPPSRPLNNAPSQWWPVPPPSGMASAAQDAVVRSDDDTPPRLQHAESPTPDPFNFIATVRRKMENTATVSPASQDSSESGSHAVGRSPRLAAEEQSVVLAESVRSDAARGGLGPSQVLGHALRESASSSSNSHSLPGIVSLHISSSYGIMLTITGLQ